MPAEYTPLLYRVEPAFPKLRSNWSHCHRKWGGGNADFQLLAPLSLAETGTLGVAPAHGDFGIAGARLLVPGAPERSLIYHRRTRLGIGRIPHVASNLVDEVGTRLVREWIAHLYGEDVVPRSLPNRFASARKLIPSRWQWR